MQMNVSLYAGSRSLANIHPKIESVRVVEVIKRPLGGAGPDESTHGQSFASSVSQPVEVRIRHTITCPDVYG